MQNDIDFINAQIMQSKARLFEFTTAREQEEKKLVALNGALETLQMLSQKQQVAAAAVSPTPPAAPTQGAAPADAIAAGAAERAASRAS